MSGKTSLNSICYVRSIHQKLTVMIHKLVQNHQKYAQLDIVIVRDTVQF